jgi:PAS domain S-box-containing protein
MDRTRILVVEDEALVARNIQNRLTKLGYVVSGVALSGSAALEQIQEAEAELVLMDIRLQGEMDGITAADEIRQRFDVPIVYLTGYADEATLDRAKLTQPYGYVLKPFEAQGLRMAIEMALYKHQVEQNLRRRNRELAVLNRISLIFTSSLDQSQVLKTVLDEVRNVLGVAASSIWLTEPDGEHMICRQVTGPGAEIVRGWRLAVGEGVVGWVARHGESLIVSDLRTDRRHFPGVDEETGVELRSLLGVPLQIQGRTIGVIQVLDITANRFQPSDLALVESLASSAAIAIENAQLYRETDQLRAFNQGIVQSIQEGILLEDEQGLITFVNPKACELLGYEREALIGKLWAQILAPQDSSQPQEKSVQKSHRIAGQYEARLLTHDGALLPVIVNAHPLFESERFMGVLSAFTDISARVQAEQEREQLIQELQEALSKVKMLSGLLPICSSCKKIRDDRGYWHRVEEYIHAHSEADFSHGLCPECAHRLYPEIFTEESESIDSFEPPGG